MSRLFTSASSQYLIAGSAPVTADPITLACWIRPTTTPVTQVAISLNNATTNARWMLVLRSTDFQALRIDDASANVGPVSASGTNSAGTWVHGTAVFNLSPGNVLAYRNGVAGNPVTNPGTAVTVNRFLIGARIQNGIFGAFCNADIAEVGVWNAALSAAEIASLAAGYSPDNVRPQSLRAYVPLIRDIQELVGGLQFSVGGSATSVSDHPRIIL